MSYIAGRIQTNIRELEGALIRVAAYASLTRSEVTLELAQGVLQSLLPNASEARVTSDLVISVSAELLRRDPRRDLFAPAVRGPSSTPARWRCICAASSRISPSRRSVSASGAAITRPLCYAINKVKQQMQERESCVRAGTRAHHAGSVNRQLGDNSMSTADSIRGEPAPRFRRRSRIALRRPRPSPVPKPAGPRAPTSASQRYPRVHRPYYRTTRDTSLNRPTRTKERSEPVTAHLDNLLSNGSDQNRRRSENEVPLRAR